MLRLARHHPAPPRHAPPCQWDVRVLDHTNNNCHIRLCENTNVGPILYYLSNPKPGHITRGSGRVGAGRRTAGRSGAGLGATPTGRSAQEIADPLAFQSMQASKTTGLDDPVESPTIAFLCKPVGEQNVRLTSGLCPVHPRDDGRSLFLAADQWNPFFGHVRHVREYLEGPSLGSPREFNGASAVHPRRPGRSFIRCLGRRDADIRFTDTP